MKVLGEEFSKVGRWYIALPPLLLIAFLVGLFFLSAAGQARLNASDEQVHESDIRLQRLSEYMTLMADAESGQRGYLLTNQSSYLATYSSALARLDAALRQLHGAYAAIAASEGDIRELQLLTGKRLGELESTLAVFKARGTTPAVNTERTDVGKRTMDDLMQLVARLRQQETGTLYRARARWRSDLRLSHWITLAGATLNIGLVVLATVLVYLDMRRRALQATDLEDQKQELESQVDARTREFTELSTHLQGVSEQEKSALSRELHDELGGLLVAARMNLSWLQQRLPTGDLAIEQRFKRIHESLSAGVDLKRRVVEELRPTLLDNMGLFAALRWQFKESCRRTGLQGTESIPDAELQFDPEATIAVFRIAQEALTNVLKHADAKSAELAVDIDGDAFVLRIADDGRGIPATRVQNSISHGISAMRHRVAALGGVWDVCSPAAGGTVVTARIPMDRMLRVAKTDPEPNCSNPCAV